MLYTGTGLGNPETGEITLASLRSAAAAGTLVGARLRLTSATAP